MKYAFMLISGLLFFTACTKNKQSCWVCEFAAFGSHPKSDTTVCAMNEKESKSFQQEHVKQLTLEYGSPSNGSATSACHRTTW